MRCGRQSPKPRLPPQLSAASFNPWPLGRRPGKADEEALNREPGDLPSIDRFASGGAPGCGARGALCSASRSLAKGAPVLAPRDNAEQTMASPDVTKIPTTIVTGFLGAGKTTLIRHLIENARGRRLALLVNEFGDVGVDGEILRGCGDACPEENIIELANGCICCTVADDFVPAIETLLSRPQRPDHIVIETSGLALPKPLVKAFDWPSIRSRLTVDGVVTVVDGAALAAGRFADDPEALAAQRQGDPALDHDNPLEEVFEDQLLCADMVVLNKTDLLTGDEL